MEKPTSGPEAIEQSDLCQPELVLIDYSHVLMVLKRLSKSLVKHPKMAVVGFTSDVPEVIEHFKQAGVSQVMSKDSDPQHLLKVCLLTLSA